MVEPQQHDTLVNGLTQADVRQQVVEFEDAMEQTDDPGILMQGLDYFIDNISKPGDWTRAYMAEVLELDVDPTELRDGRLEPDKFLKSLLPEDIRNHVDLEQISEQELAEIQNLPWSEQVLRLGGNMTRNVGRLGAQIGVDVATDPLSFLAGSVGFLKKAYQGVKKATETAGNATKATRVKGNVATLRKEIQTDTSTVAPKPAELKTIAKKRETGEEMSPEELKIIAEFPQTKPTSLGTKPVMVVSAKSIANDASKAAAKIAKETEKKLGVPADTPRTIEQAQIEGADALVKQGLGQSIADLKSIPVNTPVNDVQMAQYAQVYGELSSTLHDIAKQYQKAVAVGLPADIAKLEKQGEQIFQTLVDVEQSVRNTQSATGRALRFIQETDPVSALPFRKVLEESGGRFDVMLEGLSKIDNPIEMAQTTQRLTVESGKGFQGFRHLLLANYMSNFATHVNNIQTSVFNLAHGGLERTIAPAVAKLTRQKPATELVDAGEFWMGAMQGFTRATVAAAKIPFDNRAAMKKLLTAKDQPRTKITDELGIETDKVRLQHSDQDSPTIKGLKMVSNGLLSVYDAGLTALGATDQFFREIITQAELSFQISMKTRRIVNNIDAAGIQKGNPPLSPVERTKLERQHRLAMVKDPESFVDILTKAKQVSNEATFVENLEGFSKKFNDLRQSNTPMGKVLAIAVPFFKGIANLGFYDARRIPGIQLFSKRFRSQLESSDPVTKQLAFSNLAVGTTFMAIGGSMAASGHNYGKYPKDKKQAKRMQELGIPEYSIGFDTTGDGKNDTWKSYKNWGVFGSILGTAANLAQSSDYIAQEAYLDAVSVAAAGSAELMLDKTIAQSVHDSFDQLMKIIDDPTTGTKALQQQLIGFSLLNPGFARFTQKVDDPFLKDEVGFLELVMAKTPFLSDRIPNERDILGDDILTLDIDPNEDSVLVQTLTAMTGIANRTGSLTKRQQQARDVMQPLLDHGIDVSRPTREFGDVVLNREQTEAYYDAFYKGGVFGIDNSLILDLANAQRDWKLTTANMDQDRIRENLLAGGMTHDQVADLTPTQILQTLVNGKVRKRKEAALNHILDKFEGLAEQLSSQKVLQSLVTGNVTNRIASDTEGRTIDSIMEQREEERAPAQSVIERVKESTDRVIEDVQLTLGGV